MTRFPLLAAPPVAPAQCVACGRPRDDIGFVDLGQEIDYFGRVYVCATCIAEMARTLGWVPPTEHRRAVNAEAAARVSAEHALVAANTVSERLAAVLEHGALELIGNVLAKVGEVGSGRDGPDVGADGGEHGGGGAEHGGVHTGRPPRRRPPADNGAPAGPGLGGAGGGPGPAAGAAAGQPARPGRAGR